MAQAMTLISSQVLGSSAASVTFSSIPGTYRDLRLVFSATLVSGANASEYIRFNGDSSSSYSSVDMAGNGSTAASGSSSTTQIYSSYVYSDVGATSAPNIVTVDVMDYNATDKHKTVLVRANQAAYATTALAGRWANTAAVTSVVLSVSSGGSFATGGTFYLYGIVG
jgi:hypothetical protein